MPKKIEVDLVKKGMFIAELDRPWMESPFLIAGFVVESDEEIQQLRDCCTYVFVDPERSLQTDMIELAPRIKGARPVAETVAVSVMKDRVLPGDHQMKPSPAQNEAFAAEYGEDIDHLSMRRGPRVTAASARESAKAVHRMLEVDSPFIDYETTSPVDVEINTAREVQAELEHSINASLERFSATQTLELEPVKEVTHSMVESMIRNPDASFLLAQLKSQDSFTYTHSVEASVLAVLFGRHLGLTPEDLNVLAMGVLLLDIGKIKLPSKLLEKKGKLTSVEVKLLKKHVDYSLKVLEKTPDLDPDIVAIVRYHHERMDGTGYPEGRKGLAIPPFARIAAIIDFYDAITHCRPYRNKVSRSKAINALYNRSGKHFQPELVEEFIQCLGVYQTGELVLLSNGEVAIVVTQNKIRRLRPIVLIVRDCDKQEVALPFTRDLEKEMRDDAGKPLSIASSLNPGAYGVSADEFYL